MSSSTPPEGDFPFDFGNLGDLSAFFQGGFGAGRDPWKTAAEMATAIASDNGTEPNLDPLQRMQVEDLARVAELQVAGAVGVHLPPTTKIEAVTKAVWAARSTEAYRPFFEQFGQAISASMAAPPESDPADESTDPQDLQLPLLKMMTQLFASIGPMLVSTSAASMIGHLGQRALGQYDLPIPRPTGTVLIVPSTIDRTSDDWDVEVDDLRLWVLIHELAAHATLSVPHVRARLEALLLDFASAFRPDEGLIAEQFGGQFGAMPFDLSDLASGKMPDPEQLNEFARPMSDPDALLSMMRSPAQDLLVPQLDALVAAILGFVDYTVDTICRPLITSHDRIRDRMRERWIHVAPADRFMERLFGLEIDEATLDRGQNFVDGIVERAGDKGLQRLWANELDLPTAAEVDAPGLWLARIGIGIDGDETATRLDVPDDLSGIDDLP